MATSSVMVGRTTASGWCQRPTATRPIARASTSTAVAETNAVYVYGWRNITANGGRFYR